MSHNYLAFFLAANAGTPMGHDSSVKRRIGCVFHDSVAILPIPSPPVTEPGAKRLSRPQLTLTSIDLGLGS